jgi:hypothetical protein
LALAASLWHSALKPAELAFDYLPGLRDVGSGGINDIPSIYELRLIFALTNAGAPTGLRRVWPR